MGEWVHKRLKLAHHQHTGLLLPHYHTSYGVLLVLLVFMGVVIAGSTTAVFATTLARDDSVDLEGKMMGPAPDEAPIIQNPPNNAEISQSELAIIGTCQARSNTTYFVQIYRNHGFAGSDLCSGGHFRVPIFLFKGRNELTARMVDNLGQFGPTSTQTVVYRGNAIGATGTGTAASSITSSTTPVIENNTSQLSLTTDSPYLSGRVNSDFAIPLIISGGTPPYGVLIQWGDGNSDLVVRREAGKFEAKHHFATGGLMNFKAEVTDALGAQAGFQSIIPVEGPLAPTTSDDTPPVLVPSTIDTSLKTAWYAYGLTVSFVAMFWIGQRFELYMLKKHHMLR